MGLTTLEIGKRILEYRQNNDMPRTRLAKKMGCTDTSIYSWEKGQGAPSLQMLGKLEELGILTKEDFPEESRYYTPRKHSKHKPKAKKEPIVVNSILEQALAHQLDEFVLHMQTPHTAMEYLHIRTNLITNIVNTVRR